VIGVDATSFLVIVATAAIASLAVTVLGPRVAVPVVVVEILLGLRLRRDQPREPGDRAHRASEPPAAPAEAGAP
jgi:hypothetical protein